MVIDKKGININICFSSDNNYAQHLGVTIISILKNAKKEDNYNFYIMDGGINKKNKNKLDKLKKIKDFNITYINIDNQDFSNCPMTNYVNYITLPTYYRFKIPTFFPDIDKILYMDCDMIVRSDIAPLFETNIDNYYLAAVPEVFNHNHKERLEFKSDEYYFNAGLLLINNKKWKEDNIEKRLFEYALNPTHEILYQDQDILNEVLKSRVKYLPLKWNLQHDTIFYDESYLFHKDERIDALEEPFIIHFTHKLKPWLIECTNPYKYEYKKYLRISPWKSHIYKMRYERYKQKLFINIKNLPKLIFSVRNQNIHKVISLFGIQIKLKSKTLFFKQQINEIKEYQYWKMDKLESLLQHICAENEKISNNEHRLCEHINLIDSEIISMNKKMNKISEELLSDNQINKLILNQDELLNRVEDLKNIFQGTKHDYLKNEQSINMQSSLILEDLLKNNDVEQNILNLLKINGKMACSVWSNKVQDMLSNMEYLFENNTHIEFLEKGDYSADLYILWGTQPYSAQINILRNAIYRNKPFIILEDGFLKSIETSACKNNYNKYHKGVSFVADTKNIYYDARQSSTLEQMLNDKNLIITDEQKKRARACIDKIVETHLTKYNHQPIYEPNIGRNGVKKVLVVDQSYGDMSIAKGLASDDTFRQMLEDAITENPNADIIVKTHPDTIAGAGGYYKGLKAHDNIYTMTEAINPISLIKYCDEVYVCTTQLGFEALMCDKTVHVYGMPFYAGWGLTDDKQICERRTNKRSLEEVFYIAYIMYTYYVNPDKKCRCEIEDAIEYLLKLRDEYFSKKLINISDNKSLFNNPYALIIDTTLLCNNSCSFCWRSNFPDYLKEKSLQFENKTMSFDTYQKIIDDACQYDSVRWLSLCGPMGEPLLNDRIEDFYEYAYNKNHFEVITINTNGLAIHKKNISKLLNTIHEFSISIDSIRPETYEKIHGHKNFQQVITNIKLLVEYKKEHNALSKIVVRFTENDYNRGQFSEFKDFFEKIGVDEINYTQEHAFAGVNTSLSSNITNKMCNQPNCINFNFLGELTTCCINWHLEPVFGSIHNYSLKELWESKEKMIWNQNFNKSNICQNCGGLGISQNSQRIKLNSCISNV